MPTLTPPETLDPQVVIVTVGEPNREIECEVDEMLTLQDFYEFVGAHLAEGRAHMTPEEVLISWHEYLDGPPNEPEDDLEAIQEALDDIENGDVGMPFEEWVREFRIRHNLPPES